MAASVLPRTVDAIQQGIAERLHIGAQLYVSVRGRAVADEAFGEARPGVAMTPETLMPWQSAGKPLTAVAIGQLWERKKLRLDDPVARHVPEFGQKGKEGITIRHLLTHTSPLRGALLSNWDRTPWEETIARICAARPDPNWVPGHRAGYHPASSWFMLGEIVRRVSGRMVDEYLREEVLLPLEMKDSWLAMSGAQYRAYGQRMGMLHNTETAEEVRPNAWDTEEQAGRPRPGASMRGPIRELGRFYEMLLNHGELEGTRVLTPQTVEAMTARHRVAMMDQTFRHVMDWGLGFMLNSAMYGAEAPYGYGPHASYRTFGHGGAQSSAGFADPERRLVVAVLLNGTPGEGRHQGRMRRIVAAIYADMGWGGETRNPKPE